MENEKKQLEQIEEVEGLETEVMHREVEALDKLVRGVAKGLRPRAKIMVLRSVHNCDGNCQCPDQEEFSEKRGTLISQSDIGGLNLGTGQTAIDKSILYWVGDGWAEVHREGHSSQWQNHTWGWTASLKMLSTEEVVTEWGFDVVVEDVKAALERRLSEMVGRRNTAEERLNRLQRILDA